MAQTLNRRETWNLQTHFGRAFHVPPPMFCRKPLTEDSNLPPPNLEKSERLIQRPLTKTSKPRKLNQNLGLLWTLGTSVRGYAGQAVHRPF